MTDSAPRKLNALTALRFVAAAAIVLVHAHGFFGLPADLGSGRIRFSIGVSFFFVLSGFILAYVYEKLDTWPERGRFLRARVARLWPAHAFAFLLLFLLLKTPSGIPGSPLQKFLIGVTNLGMVHAWIPSHTFFWSYNNISWSISTEFGFYLFFLLLIPGWKRTWHWKLGLIGSLTLGLIYVFRKGYIPIFPFDPTYFPPIGQGALIYISPLGRLFEFALGMATALLFKALAPRLRLNRWVATAIELFAIVAVLGFQHWATGMEQRVIESRNFGQAGATWLVNSGGCVTFAFLIFCMALEAGWISQLIACPAGVLLGEISYSVYLLHMTFLRYYTENSVAFEGIPLVAQFFLFWAILLLSSYLVWSAIERPMRDWIGGRSKKKALVKTRSWGETIMAPGWGMVGLQTVALACLVGPVAYWVYRPLPLASAGELQAMTAQSLPEARDVQFGDRFVLRAASLRHVSDGVVVRLAWQSRKDQELSYWVVLQPKTPGHAAYPNGNHRQTARPTNVRQGDTWIEEVKLPAGSVKDAKNLVVGLWRETDGCLQADHGPRDPETQFIMLPLPRD